MITWVFATKERLAGTVALAVFVVLVGFVSVLVLRFVEMRERFAVSASASATATPAPVLAPAGDLAYLSPAPTPTPTVRSDVERAAVNAVVRAGEVIGPVSVTAEDGLMTIVQVGQCEVVLINDGAAYVTDRLTCP